MSHPPTTDDRIRSALASSPGVSAAEPCESGWRVRLCEHASSPAAISHALETHGLRVTAANFEERAFTVARAEETPPAPKTDVAIVAEALADHPTVESVTYFEYDGARPPRWEVRFAAGTPTTQAIQEIASECGLWLWSVSLDRHAAAYVPGTDHRHKYETAEVITRATHPQ